MASDTGSGQQEPTDSSGDYNKTRFVIEQALSRISTMKYVVVKAVDTAAKTVDVQPMVNQIDGDLNATQHGLILGIPYLIWQYGKNAIQADPVVDDIGLMICADRDSSSVVKTKAISPPGSLRQLDIADGVYLGGVLNGDPEQWVKFTDTGMELHDKNANSLVSSSAGWEFTGIVKFNQATVMEGALQLAGAIQNDSGGVYSQPISTSADIHTTGTLLADTDVQASSGASKVTMKGHFHSANNTPPTPGH